MIFSNIRLRIVEEDIKAQIGGTLVGERGVKELVDRYGLPMLLDHIEYLYDSTERMVRKEIEAIPDGSYRGESWAFYDGVNPGSRMKINLAVTVAGSEITFDFTGSSPQTPGFVNAPFSATASALLLTFLMLISSDIPHNAGFLRPLKIVNPEGSFLNARFPAATTFGNSLTGPTSDAIFRAFAQAIPQMVTAGWNRMLGLTLAGFDPRHARSYVDILFIALKGGSGATFGADGYDHIGLINCGGGLLAQDYEMFEIQDPHVLVRHEYAMDSAGAGRWRGGLGVETEFRIDGDDVTGIVFGDGVDEEARGFGMFGGKPGSLNEIVLTDPEGRCSRPRSKEIVRGIRRGTVVRQRAGGGGGYGDARERPIEHVLEDVRDGFVSVASAREDYGVAIDPLTLAADLDATRRLREKPA
jgi:N-methylhydantoinase B